MCRKELGHQHSCQTLEPVIQRHSSVAKTVDSEQQCDLPLVLAVSKTVILRDLEAQQRHSVTTEEGSLFPSGDMS